MAIWEVGDDDRRVEGLDENGRPDPHYAAALGLVPAPLPRRAAGAVIDAAFYLLLQVPYWIFTLPLLLKFLDARISWYGLVNHPQFLLAVVILGVSFVLSLAYCIVQLVFHGRKGITIGKAMTGLRSINVATLERPGVFRVLLRVLVLWASGLVLIGPILFLLSPLVDPEKRGRGWHDRVGRLWLVDIRHGLQPYDGKRMRIARKTVTAEPVAQSRPLPSLATPVDPGAEQAYRPGARVSAGVLGVARPHGDGPRPVVGLSGTERPDPGHGPAPAVPGRPVLGAYRRPTDDEHDGAPAEGPSPQPEVSRPAGPAGPTSPAGPAGPGAAAREHDGAAPTPGPVVTGTPWSASPPPGPAPAPDPQPQPQPQHSGQAHAPVPPRPATDAPGGAAAVLALRLDSGELVKVAGPVVIGRNPVPPHTAPEARRQPLPDDTRSVSKTHLLVRPAPHGLEVIDQGSTNGTAIVHAGAERELAPGAPAVAAAGDMLRIGERTAVVVSG